jgi:uncharacterized membrane protein YdbT with pleckstrin-like domain
MASYIERSLGEGETVITRAHFHWLYVTAAWLALLLPALLVLAALGWHLNGSQDTGGTGIVGLSLAVPLLLIGLWIFLAMMIQKWTTEIGVTSHRFVMKTGLFTLRSNEIALPNIEGVKVVQNFIGRIFDYGTVRIEGTGVDAVTTPTIADPVGFVRGIQTAKEHVAGLSTKA